MSITERELNKALVDAIDAQLYAECYELKHDRYWSYEDEDDYKVVFTENITITFLAGDEYYNLVLDQDDYIICSVNGDEYPTHRDVVLAVAKARGRFVKREEEE